MLADMLVMLKLLSFASAFHFAVNVPPSILPLIVPSSSNITVKEFMIFKSSTLVNTGFPGLYARLFQLQSV